MACAFFDTSSDGSLMTCRRSLWPARQNRTPRSFNIGTDTSPVNAPSFSQNASCAPSSTFDPARACPTASMYMNGGATPTCTWDGAGAPFATALANSTAEALFVFIFQLPATKGMRGISLFFRGIHHRVAESAENSERWPTNLHE